MLYIFICVSSLLRRVDPDFTHTHIFYVCVCVIFFYFTYTYIFIMVSGLLRRVDPDTFTSSAAEFKADGGHTRSMLRCANVNEQ
jgi:hypothetical protein